jgi:hypothetical protein
MEEVPAFAEDAAEHFWEGKLAVGSFVYLPTPLAGASVGAVEAVVP